MQSVILQLTTNWEYIVYAAYSRAAALLIISAGNLLRASQYFTDNMYSTQVSKYQVLLVDCFQGALIANILAMEILNAWSGSLGNMADIMCNDKMFSKLPPEPRRTQHARETIMRCDAYLMRLYLCRARLND